MITAVTGLRVAAKDLAPKSAATSGDAATGPVSIGQNFGYSTAASFNVGSGSADGSATAGAGLPLNTVVIVAGVALVLGFLGFIALRKS